MFDLDMSAPIVRYKTVKAVSPGSIRTIVSGDFGEFAIDEAAPAGSGTGPSPLQAVLGALCGCLAITLRRVATERGFQYRSAELDGKFAIDIRGRLGMAGIVPYFNEVKVVVSVDTKEAADAFDTVVKDTLIRSPVYNLIKDTSTKLDVQWLRATPWVN